MQRPLQTPPPLWGRSTGRRPVGRGVFFRARTFLPPSLTLPQSKSDVSDLDRSSIGRTREHPSSVGGGNRPSLPPPPPPPPDHPRPEPAPPPHCPPHPPA